MIWYGIGSGDLEHAASLIARVLGLTFELHDSSYFGGDYYLKEVPAGKVRVQPNLDFPENEPFREDWPLDQYLLSFDGPDNESWLEYIKQLAPLLRSGDLVLLEVHTLKQI